MKTGIEGFRDGILILAGVAVLLALLRNAADIIVPFLLSLLIATIAATPINWLKQRGLSTLVSVLLVVLAIIVVLSMLTLIMGNTVAQFNEALPVYQARLDDVMASYTAALEAKGIPINEAGILSALDPAALMGFANSMVAGIGSALSNTLLIIFTVIFMLIDAASFPRKLAAIRGMDAEATLQRLAEIIENINRYVVTKAFVSLLTGLLIWMALALIGLDFAPLWGFLAFLLNFVPNIGSIIAAVPAVLLAFGTGGADGAAAVRPAHGAGGHRRVRRHQHRHRQHHRTHRHGPARRPIHAGGVPVTGVLGLDVRTGRHVAVGAA